MDDQASALTVDGDGYVYVTGTSGLIPDLDYATVKYAPDGTRLWARRYDSGSRDLEFSYAIATGHDGSVFVTGASVLNHPFYDYLTIKYSPSGDTLWTRRYDGPAHADDFAQSLAVDTLGNAYVTGYTTGIGSGKDITTIKYTPSGDVTWVRTVDGPAHGDDQAFVVRLDRFGNPHVAGECFTSPGSWDFFAIKYDPAGNVLSSWPVRYNGPGNSADEAFALNLDAAGNVYVAGRSVGSGFDYAVVKYDPTGAFLWARRFNGAADGRDDCFASALDSEGNVYLTGFSENGASSEDIVTIKYAPNGDSLWVRGYNGPANLDDYAYAVAVGSDGLVYVCGLSNGGATSYDIVTMVYLPNGTLACAERFDGSAHGYDNPGNGYFPTPYLAVDPHGNAYITGFASNLGGASDFVTVKYGPGVADVAAGRPERFELRPAQPNPGEGRVTIRFDLPAPQGVSVEVFDLAGHRVHTVVASREFTAGSHDLVWNGVDEVGTPVEAGVYFLRVTAGTTYLARKLVILR